MKALRATILVIMALLGSTVPATARDFSGIYVYTSSTGVSYLDITDVGVVATVIDNGGAFDPSEAPEPDVSLPLDKRDPGGLGILLIRRMVDRVEYRRVGNENRLRLEKARG